MASPKSSVERERPPQVKDDPRCAVGAYIADGTALFLVDGYHQTSAYPVPHWHVVLEDQKSYDRRQVSSHEITKPGSDWTLAQPAPTTTIPAKV